jgi:hypothetical protein
MEALRLIGGIIIPAIIVVAAGIAFLNVFFVSAQEVAIWLLLRRHGKVGEVTIDGLCKYKPGVAWLYQVRFRSQGKDATFVIQTIRDKTYKRLQERNRVTVAYLPGTPLVARLWGEDADNVSRNTIILIGVVLFIVASFQTSAWLLAALWMLTVALFYVAPRLINRLKIGYFVSWGCAE